MNGYILIVANISDFTLKINWEAVSAVGSCFAALATFFACCIALWQTKYSNMKKLKLVFSDNTVALSNTFERYYISVDVRNIGNRDIQIQELALYVKRKKRYVLMLNKTTLLNTDLPFMLPVECAKTLYFDRHLFFQNVALALKNKEINGWNKLKLGIKDSSGRIYYVKSPKRVSYYISLYKDDFQ